MINYITIDGIADFVDRICRDIDENHILRYEPRYHYYSVQAAGVAIMALRNGYIGHPAIKNMLVCMYVSNHYLNSGIGFHQAVKILKGYKRDELIAGYQITQHRDKRFADKELKT